MMRSTLEILGDILLAIRDNQNELIPTHVMYKANIDWTNMTKSIQILKERGLINCKTGELSEAKPSKL